MLVHAASTLLFMIVHESYFVVTRGVTSQTVVSSEILVIPIVVYVW